MPAAAVIPAPIAYIKVVAVKKLVVGFLTWNAGPPGNPRCVLVLLLVILAETGTGINLFGVETCIIYCEKIRVFKAGASALNTLAWNNKIGPWRLFCWFAHQGND